ncbi:MAG: PAC2 family protein [Anaerolineae bacterium]|nr:PAC2 family protein [Anaerolineae bacterium]
MPDAVEIWERPEARHIYMLAGWRQWADAGSASSGLPHYLIQQTDARKIGQISPDGFYIFQIPGTHDLVRPVVKFDQGYPQALDTQRNELYYTGDSERGVVIFLGDEPHLDIERYTSALLEAARRLKVERIVAFGGVYGELPYNKERMISGNYSLPRLKDELAALAVSFSDYHGGASIGSYICRRAGEQNMEYVGMYAMVPTYDFSSLAQAGNSIRIENDFMAWLGIMRRVNFMLKTSFNLADLERKSERLIQVVDSKVDELDSGAPQLGVREYLARLEEDFTEVTFDPLDDVWEQELRRLFDDPESADDTEG